MTPIGTQQGDGSWCVEKSEFMKGEIAGLMLVKVLPEQIIDTLERQIEEDNEDGN